MKTLKSIITSFGLVIFFTACTEGPETGNTLQTGQEESAEVSQPESDSPQDFSEFSTWDQDQDAYISQSEYAGVLRNNNAFSNMDYDGDEAFGPDEWSTTMYKAYDEDENQQMTQEEWDNFSATWNREGQWGDFNEMDTDRDGLVTQDEWEENISNTGTFQDWKTEAADEDAFNEGFYNYTYNTYDFNRDQQWDESEFNRYTKDWRNN